MISIVNGMIINVIYISSKDDISQFCMKKRICTKKETNGLVIAQNSIVHDLSPILMARNIRTPYTFLIRIGINTMTAQKMLQEIL